MAVTPVAQTPSTRPVYPGDPQLNMIIQDIYNRLNQIQAQLVLIQKALPPTP